MPSDDPQSDDQDIEPSAGDGAAGDDRSSERSEPTPPDEAEPQPN
jgi:hypothetical protein